MHKTILIMRQEIKRMLRSTGYVIFAYVVPVAATQHRSTCQKAWPEVTCNGCSADGKDS